MWTVKHDQLAWDTKCQLFFAYPDAVSNNNKILLDDGPVLESNCTVELDARHCRTQSNGCLFLVRAGLWVTQSHLLKLIVQINAVEVVPRGVESLFIIINWDNASGLPALVVVVQNLEAIRP